MTNETYKITHQFECNKKRLVYLLTSKTCLKQYAGQTIDTFQHRWNNYTSNTREIQWSKPCMQEHLFQHFSSTDVFVAFIDKTDPSDPLKCKNFWRETLMTMTL